VGTAGEPISETTRVMSTICSILVGTVGETVGEAAGENGESEAVPKE